jgi:flagellar hook-basal body complex protein FliE
MKIETNNSQLQLLNTMELMKSAAAETPVMSHPLSEANPQNAFADALISVVDGVNHDQVVASSLAAAVDSGRSNDLVGAMVASQKASISLSALVQGRNKVVDGLEKILQMPV